MNQWTNRESNALLIYIFFYVFPVKPCVKIFNRSPKITKINTRVNSQGQVCKKIIYLLWTIHSLKATIPYGREGEKEGGSRIAGMGGRNLPHRSFSFHIFSRFIKYECTRELIYSISNKYCSSFHSKYLQKQIEKRSVQLKRKFQAVSGPVHLDRPKNFQVDF